MNGLLPVPAETGPHGGEQLVRKRMLLARPEACVEGSAEDGGGHCRLEGCHDGPAALAGVLNGPGVTSGYHIPPLSARRMGGALSYKSSFSCGGGQVASTPDAIINEPVDGVRMKFADEKTHGGARGADEVAVTRSR